MKSPKEFVLAIAFIAILIGKYCMASDLEVLNQYFRIDTAELRSAEFDDVVDRARSHEYEFIHVLNNPKPQQSGFMVLRQDPNGASWSALQSCKDLQNDRLLDWAFVDNGILVGGYTIKRQFERMKSESRKLDIADAVSFYIPPIDFDWKSKSICLMRSIGYQDIENVARIYASHNQQYIQVAKRKPLTRGMTEDTPLNYAVCYSSIDMVKCLVELGNDVNGSGNIGATPLFSAAASGKIEIVKYLLEMGARIDVADERGLTPIAIAVINDQTETVTLLLDLGANVKCIDNDGNSLAHLIAKDNTELAETLAAYGVNMDQEDGDGFAPIHCAAMNGFLRLTEWYVLKGSDLSKQNKNGKTPIDLVRENRKLGEKCAVHLIEIAKSVR